VGAAQKQVEPAGWARVWSTVKPEDSKVLRKGAWYPILADTGTERIVLEINGEPVMVPRKILQIQGKDEASAPANFAVVRGRRRADGPSRYVVCPKCKARAELFAKPTTVTCHKCRHRGDVAWWEAV